MTNAGHRAFPTPLSPPPIPGLVIRHFAGPQDGPGMNDTANDARIADGDDFITSIDDLANFYGHLVNCDRDRDPLIVEVDGSIAG